MFLGSHQLEPGNFWTVVPSRPLRISPMARLLVVNRSELPVTNRDQNSDLHFEIARTSDPSEWRVEAIDEDGRVLVTVFTGPFAQQRAVEYADWKNRRRLRVVRRSPSRSA